MFYIVGLVLMLVGGMLGLIGDYPIDAASYFSLPLLVLGGATLAVGVAVLLVTAGRRGSREDEPAGYIRP